MTQNEHRPEELEQEPREELKEEEQTQPQPEPYVERPRSQRVLAWILTGIMVLGVLLYYAWISGILH